jgi:hypothetical protein
LVFVPGDHFFEGHLAEMRMTVESWLHEVLDNQQLAISN